MRHNDCNTKEIQDDSRVSWISPSRPQPGLGTTENKLTCVSDRKELWDYCKKQESDLETRSRPSAFIQGHDSVAGVLAMPSEILTTN